MREYRPEGQRFEITAAEQMEATLAKIIEQFEPAETITTDEGVEHRVFTFFKNGQPIRVVFYQREEMPFSDDLLKGRQPFLFGAKPHHRPEKEWAEYIKKLRFASDPNEDAANPGVLNVRRREPVFFVERTPCGLLDMAAVLGVADPDHIMELRKLAVVGQTNDELERMQDQVIAARLIDNQGEFTEYNESHEEAEAILLQALSGDQNAQAYLEKKLAQLTAKDKARLAEEQAEDRIEVAQKFAHVEALKPEELVAVHMTSYWPQSSEDDDSWKMATTFDATRGKVARATQHFTLNHPIESAGAYGNWEGSSICVLMPLDRMLATNGNPAVVNTIDTFWEVSPGRNLSFPKDSAWVIKPGLVGERGKLAHENGHEVMYKTSGIGPEDVRALTQSADTLTTQLFNRELQRMFHKGLVFFDPSIALQNADRDLLAEFREQPIRDVVERILTEAGVRANLGDEAVTRIVLSIENFLVKEIKLWVIKEKIRELGYRVHGGGMWAWDGDSWDATAQAAKLGAELGVPGGLPHSGHRSHQIEEGISASTYRLEKGQLTIAKFVKRVKDRNSEKASPALRRMMYQMGAI